MSPVWIREPGALEIPSGHCHSSPSSSEAASTMSFTGLHAVTMVASGLKGRFVFFPRGSSGIYRDASCVSLLPTCATMLMLMICLPVVIVKDARNIWNYVWCSLSLAVAWSLLWWCFNCVFFRREVWQGFICPWACAWDTGPCLNGVAGSWVKITAPAEAVQPFIEITRCRGS